MNWAKKLKQYYLHDGVCCNDVIMPGRGNVREDLKYFLVHEHVLGKRSDAYCHEPLMRMDVDEWL